MADVRSLSLSAADSVRPITPPPTHVQRFRSEVPMVNLEKRSSLDLAVVGNCSYAALINKFASVVWMCFPRFDGDPVFCSLLRRHHDTGFWDIEMENFSYSEQMYSTNTAVLTTRLFNRRGDCIDITDYAPLFQSHDRTWRPNILVRMVKPIRGRPRVCIRVRPTFGYGWGKPERTRGSSHIRFLLPTITLRLTTNAPISYILDEAHYELDEEQFFILMPDESLTQPIEDVARKWLRKTTTFWYDWTRILSVPFEWQDEVIRACITLKLCSYEETGAVIGAITTSIPAGPEHARNYDARYCFLRHAAGVIHTLNRLGATATMEAFLKFINNVVADFSEKHASQSAATSSVSAADTLRTSLQVVDAIGSGGGTIDSDDTVAIQPVYGLALETRLHEKVMHRLAGYRGLGPVRVGNADYQRPQHHVYGDVMIAVTQFFFDKRLIRRGDREGFVRLEAIGRRALEVYATPDLGPHGSADDETGGHAHTFSAMLCWAATDRLAKIARQLNMRERETFWRAAADRIHQEIVAQAWNAELGCFVSTFGGTDVDAYLLLMPVFNFLPATDARFVATLERVEKVLRRNKYLLLSPPRTSRVAAILGAPTSTQSAESSVTEPTASSAEGSQSELDQKRSHERCMTADTSATFWYIYALAGVGRIDEARELFQNMLLSLNHIGLIGENIHPDTRELWGNFPSTSALVGLVDCAMVLSKSWEDVL